MRLPPLCTKVYCKVQGPWLISPPCCHCSPQRHEGVAVEAGNAVVGRTVRDIRCGQSKRFATRHVRCMLIHLIRFSHTAQVRHHGCKGGHQRREIAMIGAERFANVIYASICHSTCLLRQKIRGPCCMLSEQLALAHAAASCAVPTDMIQTLGPTK